MLDTYEFINNPSIESYSKAEEDDERIEREIKNIIYTDEGYSDDEETSLSLW